MSKLIRQDNTLTNSRYDFTACQQDILFCLMNQIHDDDSNNKRYTINVKQIEELTGRKWQYAQFKEATQSMGSRMFEMENSKLYRQYWLFQTIDYVIGEGKINVLFSETAIDLLKNLKNNFTTYELQSALNMSSKYAKRIYQICSQWKDIGHKKFDIQELKHMLKLVDEQGHEQFKQITHLKEKVLDVAVKQINEHSDLDISYTMEGEYGRKKPLKTIIFYIKKKSPVMLPIEFDEVKNPDVKLQSLYNILDRLGIVAVHIVKQIAENEEMMKIVFDFNYKLSTGQITAKSPAGLLLTKLGIHTKK